MLKTRFNKLKNIIIDKRKKEVIILFFRVKFENRTKSDIISLWNDCELNVPNALN